MGRSLTAIAKMIDHSLLHPTMTDDDLRSGCEVGLRHNVASVCIKPYAVPLAMSLLNGSDVAVGAVVGFPHGNSHTDIKVAEARRACDEGATEVDVVINIGKALGGQWDYVRDEIAAVNSAALDGKAILKVIFENDLLTDDAIKSRLCHICTECATAFVKTSSGYGFVKGSDGSYSYEGATDHDLALMRRESGNNVQVKAAGGVRTFDDLLRVQALGVTRIGATATEAILAEAVKRGYC